MIEEEGKLVAERTILRRESSFFDNHPQNLAYVGILTTNRATVFTQSYPRIIEGLQTVYTQLEPSTSSPVQDKTESDSDGFISWYINATLKQGRLLSDEYIEKFAKEVKEGKYSRQLKAWEDVVGSSRRQTSVREEGNLLRRIPLLNLFGGESEYRTGNNREDIIHNKRRLLTHWLALQTHIQAIYGNLDCQNALLSELILEAPFLESILGEANPDEQAGSRHKAYFDEVINFIGTFNPIASMQVFAEHTHDYEAKWGTEEKAPQMSPFDRNYLLKVAEFATGMKGGSWNIEDLYYLLRRTILTRASTFTIKTEGRHTKITPIDPPSTTFADVGGYPEQKRFYQLLLEKIAQSDPVISTLNMILVIGDPGLGKSLGLDAFLSQLPKNAKGIKINYERSLTEEGDMPEYEVLVKLARFNPGLQLFAVLEDLDAIAGDRLENPMTSLFLEMDSATEKGSTPNLHILATTNRPDVIDPAVIRPGRTTKILTYETPKEEDRKEITRVHTRKHDITLSEAVVDCIAKKSEGLTPDDIGSIVWSMKFTGNSNPSEEDIDKAVKEIKLRYSLEKKVKRIAKTSKRRN